MSININNDEDVAGRVRLRRSIWERALRRWRIRAGHHQGANGLQLKHDDNSDDGCERNELVSIDGSGYQRLHLHFTGSSWTSSIA